ncbi:UNVERIFIED_ORG: hypothetical protein GGE64_000695 [Rhizobium etli]
MADKKTPEELAKASFSERVYALGDKLLPSLGLLLAMSFALLSVANQFIEGPKKFSVEADKIAAAQKYVDDARRLFNQVAPQLDTNNLPIETKNKLAELAGSIAGAQSAIQSMVPETTHKTWLQNIFSMNVFTPAHAAENDNSSTATLVGWMRQGIVVFMIVCITFLLVGFLVLYFRTSDPEKLKFADSMIRMIVGFYIGVVTGLLGIPPV